MILFALCFTFLDVCANHNAWRESTSSLIERQGVCPLTFKSVKLRSLIANWRLNLAWKLWITLIWTTLSWNSFPNCEEVRHTFWMQLIFLIVLLSNICTGIEAFICLFQCIWNAWLYLENLWNAGLVQHECHFYLNCPLVLQTIYGRDL